MWLSGTVTAQHAQGSEFPPHTSVKRKKAMVRDRFGKKMNESIQKVIFESGEAADSWGYSGLLGDMPYLCPVWDTRTALVL